jgi:hypothetical protein
VTARSLLLASQPEIDGKEIHSWCAEPEGAGRAVEAASPLAHRRDGHAAAGERGMPEPRRLLNGVPGDEVVGQLLGH